MAMNGAGAVVFEAQATGPGFATKSGLWSTMSGSPHVIVLSGVDDARGPGLGAGVSFFANSFDNLHLNANGDAAFLAQVDGGPYSQTRGIFAVAGRSVLPIAVVGELFDVDPGPGLDLRQIGDVALPRPNHGFSGGEDGRTRLLNDNGELAFELVFEDGTGGIFVATVPEPGTASGLVTGIALLAAARRSRGARVRRSA
jgi:hypothetical protein